MISLDSLATSAAWPVRLGAVAAAAIVQFATVVYLGSSISGGDAHTYLALADDWSSWARLIDPRSFESNFWPAGYPGFLALFAWAGDAEIFAIRVAHIVLAASVALMAGVLADSLNRIAGTVTTVVVALSPTAMWAVWAIGYELLLAALLLAGLLLVWRPFRASAPWPPVAGGFLLGLALMIQFRSVTAVAVLLIAVGWRRRRVAVLALTGVVLPVLAWAARSLVAVGSPAPWSANGPYNLWNGNGPHATGHKVFPLPDVPADASGYTDAALTWIVGSPLDFLAVTGRKFLYLFEPTRLSSVANPIQGLGLVSVIEFAVVGLVTVGLITFVFLWVTHRDTGVSVLGVPFLFAAAYLLPNVLFIVEARFSIPVHGILIATSVASLIAMVRLRQQKAASKLSRPEG